MVLRQRKEQRNDVIFLSTRQPNPHFIISISWFTYNRRWAHLLWPGRMCLFLLLQLCALVRRNYWVNELKAAEIKFQSEFKGSPLAHLSCDCVDCKLQMPHSCWKAMLSGADLAQLIPFYNHIKMFSERNFIVFFPKFTNFFSVTQTFDS